MATTTVKRKRRAPRVVVPELVLAEATDGELVAAHLGGHPGAFTELYDRYRDKLVHFIARKTGDRDRAEDLVQEAFIRVTRHLHRFDQSKKFSTWIYTIAANLAKNELRNRSRQPLMLLQGMTIWRNQERLLELEDTSSRPDDLLRKRDLCGLVEDATAQLSPHHRQVFVLRDVEGKSYEEIAEITGTRVGTVKSRLSRARQSFADIIKPWVD